MDAYTGTYYIQGGEEQTATLVFLKDKISIGIHDEFNNPRVVHWYYDKIIEENFQRGGYYMVRHEGHPPQVIEVNSREFIDKLREIIERRHLPAYKKVFNRNNATLWKLAIGIIALFLLAYLWLIPFLAVRMASKVPISYEESLGNNMYNAIKGSYEIDASKTLYINEFFRELNIQTPYKINITVVKEDVANAFAIPGGNIIVYDKILKDMKGYEELAALLSHEFIHVHNRHSTKSLFRQLGSTIFLSVVIGDVGTIGSIMVNNADRLKGLSYSRGLERESDIEGLKILSDRKIDGNGFVELFRLLGREAKGPTTEWINSHPNIEKRIEYIKESEYFNKNGVEKSETLETIFKRIKEAA